jgi:hypothetical protein
MNDTLESMLEFFLEPIRLQDIDDADKQEQPLALVVTCWNASGTRKKIESESRDKRENEAKAYGTSSSSSIGSLSAWILSMAVECATKRCRFMDL